MRPTSNGDLDPPVEFIMVIWSYDKVSNCTLKKQQNSKSKLQSNRNKFNKVIL